MFIWEIIPKSLARKSNNQARRSFNRESSRKNFYSVSQLIGDSAEKNMIMTKTAIYCPVCKVKADTFALKALLLLKS